jgi:hypothetical protein
MGIQLILLYTSFPGTLFYNSFPGNTFDLCGISVYSKMVAI